jgi:hypothetical protein
MYDFFFFSDAPLLSPQTPREDGSASGVSNP